MTNWGTNEDQLILGPRASPNVPQIIIIFSIIKVDDPLMIM
jgi:hypothetical protein